MAREHGFLFAVGALTLAMTACERLAQTTSPHDALLESRAAGAFYTGEQARNLQAMVHLLAEGLGDADARAVLYNALQESRFVENKLILAEFLQSAAGSAILDAAARRSGTTRAQVDHTVSGLPPIDLYIPHPQHRRTWQPSGPIAVATLLDASSPLTAYVAGGSRVPIDRRSRTPTDVAVLLLGPAEAKLQRALLDDCCPDCLSQHIDGPTRACEGGGGGGGGGSDPDSTFLHRLITSGVCDNGFCWETNEFEFRATADSSGTQWTPVLRCEGVPSTGDITFPNAFCSDVVIGHAPSSGHQIDVLVVETDGWPNPDDNWIDWGTPPPGFASHPPYLTASDAHNTCCYQRDYALYKWTGQPPDLVNDPHVEVQFRWPTR